MDLQQSQTFKNMQSAYETESINSTLYSIYADTARQEGFIEIGNVYDTTLRNEKEHARIWLRHINNGTLPNTAQQLLSSMREENRLGNDVYRDYARTAISEGFGDIAALFNGIANIHLNHGLNFRTLYDNVENNEVFCKPDTTLWICMQCGNIMSGTCAPKICPVCGFPQGYYRVYDPNVMF